MTPDDIRMLLGGYATGTLTEEERAMLYSAALEDQKLFDALADEDALRELLAEPQTRQQLLRELNRVPTGDPAQLEPFHENPVWARAATPSSPAPPPPMAPAQADIGGSQNSLENSRASHQPLLQKKTSDVSSGRNWFPIPRSPRQLAFVGGVAMILLVLGGMQYARYHSITTQTVEIAMNKAAESGSASRQAAQQEVESRIPKNAIPMGLPNAGQLREQKIEAQASAPSKPGVPSELNKERDLNKVGPPNNKDVAPAAPPAAAPPLQPLGFTAGNGQIADEKQAAPSEKKIEDKQVEDKKAEKDVLAAAVSQAQSRREENDRRARDQIPSSRVGEAGNTSPANSAASSNSAPLVSAPKAPQPAGPARVMSMQKASGLLVNDRLVSMGAKVTDINGTIISVGVGVNAGLKAGETLEIVRDNHVIGTIRVTQSGDTFAVGVFQSSLNATGTPRIGDAVRHSTTVQPQK